MHLNRKKYETYTARDLVLDESFQNWVLNANDKDSIFWIDWVKKHPLSKHTVDEAITLLKVVSFRSYKLTTEEENAIWNRAVENMSRPTATLFNIKRKRAKLAPWRDLFKYVAILITAITVLSVWLLVHKSDGNAIAFNAQTDEGRVENVKLPDSSEVTLNANSKIVYRENDNVRQVWLKGEGYFHVKHTKDNKSFVVHAENKVSVTVLGTRFNVNTFGTQISVVLAEGSIRLSIANLQSKETELYLNPGEMLKYNKQNGDYAKTDVNVEQSLAWVEGKLIMNNYSLQDVALFMQQTFGKSMIINDQTLIARRISGSLPISNNLNTMLLEFEQLFNVKIRVSHDKLIVDPK